MAHGGTRRVFSSPRSSRSSDTELTEDRRSAGLFSAHRVPTSDHGTDRGRNLRGLRVGAPWPPCYFSSPRSSRSADMELTEDRQSAGLFSAHRVPTSDHGTDRGRNLRGLRVGAPWPPCYFSSPRSSRSSDTELTEARRSSGLFSAHRVPTSDHGTERGRNLRGLRVGAPWPPCSKSYGEEAGPSGRLGRRGGGVSGRRRGRRVGACPRRDFCRTPSCRPPPPRCCRPSPARAGSGPWSSCRRSGRSR